MWRQARACGNGRPHAMGGGRCFPLEAVTGFEPVYLELQSSP